MKLSQICKEIELTCLQGSMEAEVADIIYDSRKIEEGTMFVCMVGAVTDGHKYIQDAVAKRRLLLWWKEKRKLHRFRMGLRY